MSSTNNCTRIRRILHEFYGASRSNFAVTFTMATLAIVCAGCRSEHHNQADSDRATTPSIANSAPTKLPPKPKSAPDSQPNTRQLQSSRPAADSASSSSGSQSSVAIKQWQYCLAPSHAQHLLYVSLPFSPGTHADIAFAQMLRQVRHDGIKCPIRDDEASISVMRQHAITVNRNAGNTIVTWGPPHFSQPKSENINTPKSHPRSDDFVWQYCLAPSYAERKVYVSPPFSKGANTNIAFDQMLHQVQHEAVQCPIADDEMSISTMREYAISFNRSAGNTVVLWEPPKISEPASEDMHTDKIGPRPDDFAWQYCLAPSYAEKKVYISSPFPKSTSLSAIEGNFGETLSQSKEQHDVVQCPIGKDEQSILSMRERAISFNHDRGYTIITRNWKPLNLSTDLRRHESRRRITIDCSHLLVTRSVLAQS